MKTELFWLQWEMLSIGNFWGNSAWFATYRACLNRRKQRPREDTWCLKALNISQERLSALSIRAQFGGLCHLLGKLWPWMTTRMAIGFFPRQSTRCFKLSECFLWHSICSADVKIWNYFIFSVCWVTVSFLLLLLFPFWKFFIHKEFLIQTLFILCLEH